jgi:anti-anti-sigma factor
VKDPPLERCRITPAATDGHGVSADGEAVDVVVGELDLEGGARLERYAADMSTAPRRRFVVDVSRVSFVDIAGIRSLQTLASTQAARGVTMALRGPTSAVRRLVRLLGLESTLPYDGNGSSARPRPSA